MADTNVQSFTTPRDGDLGLRRIANASGLSAALLPNGTVFAIEHAVGNSRVMAMENQGRRGASRVVALQRE